MGTAKSIAQKLAPTSPGLWPILSCYPIGSDRHGIVGVSVYKGESMVIITKQSEPDRKIDDLEGKVDEEHKFANFAYHLMSGREIDGHWLRIIKLNNPTTKNDPAIFEVDFGIQEDGITVGYIDIENKPGWIAGEWPYPKTNVALYPMTHWKNNHFNGGHTVKLQRFSQKPQFSFWIGTRSDYGALWIVWFRYLVEHGRKTTQRTRFSEVSLPVIEVPNQYCTFIDNEDDFTKYIIDHYKGDEW